ncbi:MAG: hypothetical protein PHC61_13435 [Chitinivibrionales bacterium]|nr:hypothetical protein [Chitinivibrionales bacterium]
MNNTSASPWPLKSFGAAILFLAFLAPSALHAGIPDFAVHDFQLFLAVGKAKLDTAEVVVLRSFFRGNNHYFLTANPITLTSGIARAESCTVVPAAWPEIDRRFRTTPYITAVHEAVKNGDSLQDAGITHGNPSQKGIDLTVDLCPSARPLDRILFKDLIDELGKEEKPLPIAIAVTGRWMKSHPADLAWLADLARKGELDITWINHSYNHTVRQGAPLNNNFLLGKGINIRYEVLQTEKMLVQHGLVPSVFFRFPGLVSDKAVFDSIVAFGLIPIGSDAWLGKGQWPNSGSIVLVHGNGNEPIGIQRFLSLLKKERKEILAKKWQLLDLRESIIESEQ